MFSASSKVTKRIFILTIISMLLIPAFASDNTWNSGEIGEDIQFDGSAYAESAVTYNLSGLFSVTIGFSNNPWPSIEADMNLDLTPDKETGTATGSTYLIWHIIAAPIAVKLNLSMEGPLAREGGTEELHWYIKGEEKSWKIDLASDDSAKKSCEIEIGTSTNPEDIKLDISTADYRDGFPAGDYSSSLKVNVSIS